MNHNRLRNNPEPVAGSVRGTSRSAVRARDNSERRGEQGYMLVALIALMTILALMLIAVAPSVRQQAQREREIEAIFRGEEIAQAIRLYVRATGGQLPTSMDQLLEGIPRGTQKIQILRASAARDPLSSSGEWRLIRPGTQDLLEFQRKIMLYADGNLPPTREGALQQYVVQMTSLVNTGSEESATSSHSDSGGGIGPFIGVASSSERESVITYYGISRHDQWVFTPLFR
jgi:type II secretory pathway pseudopilin PulG